MSNRVQNKVALVTAAGQGIGRAIAEALIAEGGIVIATDLADDKLKDLKAKKRSKLDVRAQDNIDAFAKEVAGEFGALDILVNCAGYVANGSVLDCTDKDWDFSFDLNVKSMHRMIKAFLPGMLAQKIRCDRQHLVGGVVDPRRAQPLRLRRDQGGGDRAHQVGRRRFHQTGHPLQCHLPGHDRIAVAGRSYRCRLEGNRPFA
jgi:NAD(P)-dependent dehydrogenase (short-subunit alcohol dehydrogenase family)